ncbi:unnamed protein product [Cylicocyclus nassatus]|uniref:Uncharacterized protein n=1 Tax=Cylicocyclus nassatus TaxID=53992 RepID=A0AA36H439_CYLNA|nr:unnamed protein product [Cylicocyclus nassatus]
MYVQESKSPKWWFVAAMALLIFLRCILLVSSAMPSLYVLCEKFPHIKLHSKGFSLTNVWPALFFSLFYCYGQFPVLYESGKTTKRQQAKGTISQRGYHGSSDAHKFVSFLRDALQLSLWRFRTSSSLLNFYAHKFPMVCGDSKRRVQRDTHEQRSASSSISPDLSDEEGSTSGINGKNLCLPERHHSG